MIDHGRRLIFVHIQKTGGEAVTAALGGPRHPPDKHASAAELKASCGAALFERYFKFAFVRNPWERLVSWWSMIEAMRLGAAAGGPANSFQRYVLERAGSFEDFLLRCGDPVEDHDGLKHIYRNQADYLTGADGALLVDFVGRFEHLQRDFDAAMARIGAAPIALAHVNASPHTHYSHYYSDVLAHHVGERYARDVAMFGYSFTRAQ